MKSTTAQCHPPAVNSLSVDCFEILATFHSLLWSKVTIFEKSHHRWLMLNLVWPKGPASYEYLHFCTPLNKFSLTNVSFTNAAFPEGFKHQPHHLVWPEGPASIKSTTTQYQISSIVHLTTVSFWCTRLRHQFNQGLNEELKHFYGGLGEDLRSIWRHL